MAEQGQGGGGYDIGASLSGSASSGASQSGAVDNSSSYFGGEFYGPGSLITTDQRGSIGASSGGINWGLIIGALGVGALLVWLLKVLK